MEKETNGKMSWWIIIFSSILSGVIVGTFTLIGVRLTFQKEVEARIEFEKKYDVYAEILQTFYTELIFANAQRNIQRENVFRKNRSATTFFTRTFRYKNNG